MRKLTFLIVLIITTGDLFGQSFYNRRIDRSWIASFGTGSAKYFGDLANPGQIFQSTKWNIEAGLEKRLDPRFSVRGNVTFFQIGGNDKDASGDGNRDKRNLSFTSTNIELSVTGKVQLFAESGRYYQRKMINPFAYAGIGALLFNPKGVAPATDWNNNPLPEAGKKVNLRKLKTEGKSYGTVTLAIPIGLGVKFMVSPFMNVSLDGGYRYTFTDYLDDISSTYPGISQFSDPLAAAMSDKRIGLGLPAFAADHIRGNPSKKDGYFIFSIKLEYYLPPTFLGGGPRAYKKRRYHRPKSREP